MGTWPAYFTRIDRRDRRTSCINGAALLGLLSGKIVGLTCDLRHIVGIVWWLFGVQSSNRQYVMPDVSLKTLRPFGRPPDAAKAAQLRSGVMRLGISKLYLLSAWHTLFNTNNLFGMWDIFE